MTGVTVRDVDAQKFVKAYAAHLKRAGKLDVPSWVDLVKTGAFKELAPYDPDWFYVRAASIARHLYMRPGAGVGSMKLIYGGRKNNGTRPSHAALASGSVVRKAMQALEKLKLVEVQPDGGRRITKDGQRDLDHVAALVAKTA